MFPDEAACVACLERLRFPAVSCAGAAAWSVSRGACQQRQVDRPEHHGARERPAGGIETQDGAGVVARAVTRCARR